MSTGDSPRAVATSSQTVGPFFHFGLAAGDALGQVAPADAAGERIRIQVQVADGDGAPVPDALIEIYQADADGHYGRPSFPGFGRLATDADGLCVFDTIRPGGVRTDQGVTQSPHVNVCVFSRGLLRHLYTRIYFQDDPTRATDPLLALVPADRRETLMAIPVSSPEPGAPGPGPRVPTWHFAIRLQGEHETVFFDL
jgi:protocatechuate 3,4-dioxygenase alpha subunit